ncbi:hypothetical protein PM082_020551 [Marasmius tenuissimus]|nr:hypothetical protein PM082_020551 [Marasmius tenuissimus]
MIRIQCSSAPMVLCSLVCGHYIVLKSLCKVHYISGAHYFTDIQFQNPAPANPGWSAQCLTVTDPP